MAFWMVSFLVILFAVAQPPEPSPTPQTTFADDVVRVATTDEPVTFYDNGQAVTLNPENVTTAGNPLTFLVIEETPGWLHVMLPTKPNGSTAWITSEGMTVTEIDMRIVVDLSDRELTLYQDDVPVGAWPVAIGTETTPTPVGEFYLLEKLRPPEGSVYGAYALGLSAHSETLDTFNDGPARIGIHGTTQPELIGQAVSNGCIRMTNTDVTELVGFGIPNGSPVEIRP